MNIKQLNDKEFFITGEKTSIKLLLGLTVIILILLIITLFIAYLSLLDKPDYFIFLSTLVLDIAMMGYFLYFVFDSFIANKEYFINFENLTFTSQRKMKFYDFPIKKYSIYDIFRITVEIPETNEDKEILTINYRFVKNFRKLHYLTWIQKSTLEDECWVNFKILIDSIDSNMLQFVEKINNP